jgi:hypothetical protein
VARAFTTATVNNQRKDRIMRTSRTQNVLAAVLKGNNMKNLLIITAVLEAGAGLVMVALPLLPATLMLGSSLDTPVALTVARVAGVALLALGVACWLAHHDGQSPAARGLVGGMVVYNAGVFTVLVYAGIGLGLSSSGLWPTVLVHAAMTVWCVMSLLNKPAQIIE